MKKNDLSAFTLCTVLGVSAQEVVWQKDIKVATIVTQSNEAAADPTKEADLLLALDAFQYVGMVTKYNYDPLVGVTIITPPSGIRELYVYDSANRLKQVQVRERDNAGTYRYKVLKEFRKLYKQ